MGGTKGEKCSSRGKAMAYGKIPQIAPGVGGTSGGDVCERELNLPVLYHFVINLKKLLQCTCNSNSN